MLRSKRSVRLMSSKEEVDQFLHASLQDPRRDQALFDQLVPEVNFDMRDPGLKEIQKVVRAARASSAPGPRVPYKVYKDFLLKNTYIDTSVQMGGTIEVSGCLEHTGAVTQLIREG